MKKQLFTIGTALMFAVGAVIFTSCGSESHDEAGHHDETEHHEEGEHEGHDHDDSDADMALAHYQCPMDCEEGKIYDEAGACPVCKMDLKEVETAKEAVE